jgi:o-succinylbenzoate synthase
VTLAVDPFAVALDSSLDTAAGSIAEREGFLVRVDDDDGARGLGEATPLPGWTESLADCRRALDGGDPDDSTPAARHGIALARADAAARGRGERLADHLADGTAADAVPVNATVGDADVDATAAATREAVEAGYDCVKLKVGARTPGSDEARLRAARDAAGDDVELRADANAAWDRATARRMLDVAADLDVAYVEQPLESDDLTGHAALRGRGVGVALDESLAGRRVADVLAADAADVLVCKPMALGGPDRTLDAVRRARRAGVDVVVTTTIDAVVARLGALHVAAAIPDVPACGLATGSLLAEDLAPDPAPVSAGAMSLPPGAGLAGTTLNELYRP